MCARYRRVYRLLIGLLICASVLQAPGAFSQVADPGPRGGQPGAGSPVQGVIGDALRFFNTSLSQFIEVETVTGAPLGSPPGSVPFSPGNGGLGPTFNGNACSMCHIQPAVGGTSPALNPQVAVANFNGAANTLPFFVKANGPVREARFKYHYDRNGHPDWKNPDGSVHDLFTIVGMSDAPTGCTATVLPQEDFNRAGSEHNLALRIPTPLFGAGLIENIPDATILASHASTSAQRESLGIGGSPNRSGNDNTISRFGWKAQNKSLLIFAGEAYNVELGVTNELMPNERGFGGVPPPAACLGNPTPEDETIFVPDTSPVDTSTVPSDVEDFAIFMRFLDQPTPACTLSGSSPTGPAPPLPCSPSIQDGFAQFNSVGCAACHTPAMTTGASDFQAATSAANGGAGVALGGVQANLFSDLLLHHMGVGLADGISQGLAGPDQFRSSPLWGIGQRLFFLHDGRTSDLLVAIETHASQGSEANTVIANFNALTPAQQQDVLNFLRSL